MKTMDLLRFWTVVAFFDCFCHHFQNQVFDEMEMNFEKVKEVLVKKWYKLK